MQELLIFAVVALVLLGPIVALGLAIRALSRTRALERELLELRNRTDVLSLRQRRQEAAEESLESRDPAEVQPAAPESPVERPVPSEPSSGQRPAAPPKDEAMPPPLPPPRAARPEPRSPRVSEPKPGVDLEAMLGGRLLVWIGGVALALAVAFLVKYSADQGWINEGVRVGIGIAFGLALVGIGEWLRSRSARVAQSACAAGIAALFAALLAATNLYMLIPPLVGFLGLAITTAAAVVLSLRHGPFVAGLGLLGGFLTPALIRAETPSAPLLFGYLFALQIGLLVVARQRGWWPLGLLTVFGVHVWAFIWLVDMPTGPHEPWLGLFVLASTAVTVLLSLGTDAGDAWGENAGKTVAPVIGWVGGLLGLATAAAVVHAGAFSNMEWGFLLLLSAGALALAHFDERYELLPWLSAGAGVVMLMDWQGSGVPIANRFALIAAAFGALHAVGAFVLAARAPRPGRLSALSAAATVAYLLVAHQALPEPSVPFAWGALAVALAVAHGAAVGFLLPRREEIAEGEVRLAAHAVGAAALVSFAIAFELEREWMAVGWALVLPALAVVHDRLRLRGVRVLGGVLGIVIAARLLLNPGIFDYPMGATPIFNWLLWGYLVPAACCLVAATVYRRVTNDTLVFGLDAGALAFAAAWVTFTLRHVFHDAKIGATSWTLAEAGWIGCLFLAGGGLVAWFAADRERPGLHVGGHVLAMIGLVGLVLGPGMAMNPVWVHQEVAGARIFNTLVIAYGLPAALAAAWAIVLRLRGSNMRTRFAAVVSMVMTFVFVTLEVRQWFQGAYLNKGEASNVELYAYSAAWILLGVALLVAGLRFGKRALRQAALAVMLVSVAKVFLLDMRELEDLWRVLSFFGLGVSLLALGYLYQRFVLRSSEPPEKVSDGMSGAISPRRDR